MRGGRNGGVAAGGAGRPALGNRQLRVGAAAAEGVSLQAGASGGNLGGAGAGGRSSGRGRAVVGAGAMSGSEGGGCWGAAEGVGGTTSEQRGPGAGGSDRTPPPSPGPERASVTSSARAAPASGRAVAPRAPPERDRPGDGRGNPAPSSVMAPGSLLGTSRAHGPPNRGLREALMAAAFRRGRGRDPPRGPDRHKPFPPPRPTRR